MPHQEDELTPNERLVYAALDANRRYEKVKQAKDSLPDHLREYCDITRAYREKHAAIAAVVARMGKGSEETP